MNKFLVEFIGTFFLVLTIGCTVLPGAPGVIAPLAIGSALAAMIYAGGHISGAHYNPAVTLGVFLRGKCPASDVGPYIAAQIAGSVCAALIAGFLFPAAIDLLAAKPTAAIDLPRVMVAEFLFTFALVYVVLNVATAKANAGNSYYGLAIGFTVMAGAFAVGGINSGQFNPAVSVAASLLKFSSIANIWAYLIAQLAAAFAASIVFRLTSPADFK